MLVTVALIALSVGTGFAATVWTLIGVSLWRTNKARAVFNFMVALADGVGTWILIARLLEHPINLPRGITTLLLLPIVLIPALLRLRDWQVERARRELALRLGA